MTSLLDLSPAQAEQVLFDLVDDALDVGHGDRPLGAGDADALQQLVAVEWLAPPVALDDQQRLGDLLVGREALAAGLALAPPADGLGGSTSVDHP